MIVCFFGPYVMEQMNSLLKKKLELQNIDVVECKEEIGNRLVSLIPAYVKLFFRHRKLDYDVMIIPRWRGSLAIPLAKIICRKPIVFYSYASQYDILVTDRKLFKSNSLRAKLVRWWYKFSLKYSNVIIKESDADIKYNTEHFNTSKTKFQRLFISADESMFPACEFHIPKNSFTVLYFGTFVPLHGVENIIEAAKILSENNEIVFKICGESEEKKEFENLAKKYDLKNVEFLGFVKQQVLLEEIKESDVCLGIFGNENRSSRVVTNKIYQILCSQKPLITMNSEAVKEIGLNNKENCILIEKNNPEKLADAIMLLKNNLELSKKIAESGRTLFVERLSLEKTSIQLREILQKLV